MKSQIKHDYNQCKALFLYFRKRSLHTNSRQLSNDAWIRIQAVTIRYSDAAPSLNTVYINNARHFDTNIQKLGIYRPSTVLWNVRAPGEGPGGRGEGIYMGGGPCGKRRTGDSEGPARQSEGDSGARAAAPRSSSSSAWNGSDALATRSTNRSPRRTPPRAAASCSELGTTLKRRQRSRHHNVLRTTRA